MKFEALDSWRGVCAILVALVHLSAAGHFYGWPVVRNAGFGVDFFFVLSGFVIEHAYGARLTDGRDRLIFLLRRFGRLYPLHIATLGALVLLEAVKWLMVHRLGISSGEAPFAGANSIPALFANLLLINGWGVLDDFTWNGPSWSISTEAFVYLCFCLLPASGKRKMALIVSLAAAGAVGLLVNAMLGGPLRTITGEGLFRCLFGFFLGALTYRLFRAGADRGWAPPSWAEAAALVAGIAVFAGAFPLRELTATPIFALIVWCFAFERGRVSTAMKTAAPRFLGRISYSIYMIHFPLLAVMSGFVRAAQSVFQIDLQERSGLTGEDLISIGGVWAMDGLALAYLGILIGLATISYILIEKPGRDYFNSLAAPTRDNQDAPWPSNRRLNGQAEPGH